MPRSELEQPYLCGTETKKTPETGAFFCLAEREGFEPSKGF